MANTPASRRIVFVCTGNICRSAMAEHLLRHWSRVRGLDLEVSSCGIAAEPCWDARRLGASSWPRESRTSRTERASPRAMPCAMPTSSSS